MLFFPLPPPKAQPAPSLGHLWNPWSHSHSHQHFSGSELHHLFQLPPTRTLESSLPGLSFIFLIAAAEKNNTCVLRNPYWLSNARGSSPYSITWLQPEMQVGCHLLHLFQPLFPLQTSLTLILATMDYVTFRYYVLMSPCLWICNSCSQECLSSSHLCCLSGPEFDEVSFGAPEPSILFSRIRAISLQPNGHCLYYYFTLSSSALFFIYLLWTSIVSYVRASTTH